MAQSTWTTIHKVYKNQGIAGVGAQAFKKMIKPVAKVGSLYFLERDLSLEMPPLEPNRSIVAREGTLADIHLLDMMPNAARHKKEAVERLMGGDHWFVGIDKATGRLTNHRWVSTSRAFIPELSRDLLVKPGQAYIYDLETAPEFRRQGIEATTRQFTYDTLRHRYGVNRIIVYIRADNHASLQAGRQYLTASCRVWYVRFGETVYIFSQRNGTVPELRTASTRTNQAAFRARPSSSLR